MEQNRHQTIRNQRNYAPNRELFKTPFNRLYWQLSAAEFKNVKTLIIAALIIAVRVVIKNFKIPIIPSALYFGFDFLINSVGSMIYGPLVALAVGAVSDTLGAVIFPIGTYFFPFIFVEMMSGFIFALFLYRQKLSTWRIVLSRLAVVIICNFIINPIVMTWNNIFFMKNPYEFITLARVIKSTAMFPLESVVLVFWLSAINLELYRLGLTHSKPEKLKIEPKHIIALAAALAIAVAAIIGYSYYKRNSDAKKAALDCFHPEQKVTVENSGTEKIDGSKTCILVATLSDGDKITLHYDIAAKEITEAAAAQQEIAAKCNVKVSELEDFTIIFDADGELVSWSAEFSIGGEKYFALKEYSGILTVERSGKE